MTRDYENKLRINQEWRERNRDKLRATARERYHRLKKDPEWRARKNKSSIESYRRNRHQRRQYEYGITPEEYDALVEKQEGRCPICVQEPEILAVDHDHDTGAIRGLLCRPCNAALGTFKDDPILLQRALLYLGSHIVPD